MSFEFIIKTHTVVEMDESFRWVLKAILDEILSSETFAKGTLRRKDFFIWLIRYLRPVAFRDLLGLSRKQYDVLYNEAKRWKKRGKDYVFARKLAQARKIFIVENPRMPTALLQLETGLTKGTIRRIRSENKVRSKEKRSLEGQRNKELVGIYCARVNPPSDKWISMRLRIPIGTIKHYRQSLGYKRDTQGRMVQPKESRKAA